MTCHLVIILNISTYAIVAAAAISPASAIDCSRAASVVETAICADSGLRMADERFNRGYSHLLDRLDAQQRQELIESEKIWLTGRDALCKSTPSAGVVDCVSEAIIRREDELTKKFSEGFNFGQVRLGDAGQALVVGHERLDVVRLNEDTLQLVQGNTVIAESNAPFEIDGRSGDDNGEAVVVSTHDYGNGGFSDQYLLWSLPGRPLQVEALKVDCWNYGVNKKGNRLELRTRASPGCDGIVRTWSAEGGLKFEHKMEFSPKRGTTMANFDDNESPTDNEQFYESLKRLAPRDWRPMARALSFATVRSDDDDKYVVLSPCSTGHSCQGGNAFAAYAKASQNFFFAEDLRGPGVEYFPDRSKWPTDLTRIVDEWVRGAMRD